MRQNLEELKSWSPFVEIASRKRYKQFIFRGHTKQDNELKSSLQRAFERFNVRRDYRKCSLLERVYVHRPYQD